MIVGNGHQRRSKPRPTPSCHQRDAINTLAPRPLRQQRIWSLHLLPHSWLKKYEDLRHLVVSPVGNSLTKLNTGAQLQTFSYPMASKSFLYANAFMAKSGAQSPTFKIVTNKQTNKKTQRFWPPRRWVKSDLYQTWHGDRGP